MAERKNFVLRISPQLWDAVQRLAAEDFRSVNGEIEYILTEYARKRGRLKSEPDPDLGPGSESLGTDDPA